MNRIITNAALIAVNDYYETVRSLARQSCRADSVGGNASFNKIYEPRSLFAPRGTSYTVYTGLDGDIIVQNRDDIPEGDKHEYGKIESRTVSEHANTLQGSGVIVKMDPFATVTVNGRTITHEISTLAGLTTADMLQVVLAVIAQTPPRFVYGMDVYHAIAWARGETVLERRTIHAPFAALDATLTYLQDTVTPWSTHVKPSPASITAATNAFRAVNTYRSTVKACGSTKYLDRDYHIVKSADGEIVDENIGDQHLFGLYEAVVALLVQTPLSSIPSVRSSYHIALDAPIEILTGAIAFIRRELMSRVERK